MLRKLLAPVLVVVGCFAVGTVAYASTSHDGHDSLERARRATARFRDVAVADRAGYAELRDAAGIACIDMPGMGAMGVHHVNGALVGDTLLEPATPEAVVYEPDRNGHLRLVALEYIVFQAAWDAAHPAPPALFGRTFSLTAVGNRFGLPAFYSLHAWVWKHNPAGTFAMWNPTVSCTGDHRHHGGGDGMYDGD